jgi:septum formation protein
MLADLHVPFRVLHVRFRETLPKLPPSEAARLLAWRKAETACRKLAAGLIITADTVVAKGHRLYGKPRHPGDAISMLRSLSGRTHEVITAVAVIDARTRCGMLASETSRVTFRRLSKATIRDYVDSGEPMDKAGAYAIQGEGRRLIRTFTGDRLNIIGLPVRLLARMLARFGSPLPRSAVNRLYRA